MSPRILTGSLAALLISSGVLVATGSADPGRADTTSGASGPALALGVPRRTEVYQLRRGPSTQAIRTEIDMSAVLRTAADAFEIRATRSSYDDPVRVVWKRPGGDVVLPSSVLKQWGGLDKFLLMTIRDGSGRVLATRWMDVCLNGDGQRARPDAPAHSPYPSGCPNNPFTLGSVQGIQQGWSSQVSVNPPRPVKLRVGHYRTEITIAPRYRSMFGLPANTSVGYTRLVVHRGYDHGSGWGERSAARRTASRVALHSALRPAARPTAASAPVPAGPRPDLRSLPAWGMAISDDGNYLDFSATVWNAGTSPLVVDGYRQGSEPTMDAYQYFFDTSGNQVGYQQIGQMEWDPRPSHQHWHFEDFARYRLLNADLTSVRRSSKEAFCLANTDAVDYTIPDANWNPDGTDLSTACGDIDSTAVREELSVGSGDTYSQIRAGQSFNLQGLPNGTYYIQVEANPFHRLIELDDTNNTSLRKVVIGGRAGARTVTFGPVGLVDDHAWAMAGF